MKISRKPIAAVLSLILASFVILPAQSFAETKSADDRQAKIKMHEQMAETHQKAAACLKTEKPMEECKAEMMKGCPMMKAGKKCPMMDIMDGKNGMMGHEHMDMDGMDHSKMKDMKKK